MTITHTEFVVIFYLLLRGTGSHSLISYSSVLERLTCSYSGKLSFRCSASKKDYILGPCATSLIINRNSKGFCCKVFPDQLWSIKDLEILHCRQLRLFMSLQLIRTARFEFMNVPNDPYISWSSANSNQALHIVLQGMRNIHKIIVCSQGSCAFLDLRSSERTCA